MKPLQASINRRYSSAMTPEQEERLAKLMLAHARDTGHVKKVPTETFKGVGQGSGLSDDNIIAQIELLLKQTGAPLTRLEIIANINAGTTRIGRCLSRMHAAGTIRQISTPKAPLWVIAD